MADDYLEQWEEPAICPSCKWELGWTDCDACGGEGEYDAYETDPLWYDEGDTEDCHQCGGTGGWYVCPNPECERVMV